MSDETFVNDPDDRIGVGDSVVIAYAVWSGEWYCTPWTDKPARVTVGYRRQHRRGERPERFTYLMPLEEGGFVMLDGEYGDPSRDEIVFRFADG